MTNLKYMDVSNVNTSKIINMGGLFSIVGSNVTSANWMFSKSGQYATNFSIIGLDNWDVSNVINMNSMFDNAGVSATIWDIGDLSGWDVSKVTSYGNFNNWVQDKIIPPIWNTGS